jgi:hypothetical protein
MCCLKYESDCYECKRGEQRKNSHELADSADPDDLSELLDETED